MFESNSCGYTAIEQAVRLCDSITFEEEGRAACLAENALVPCLRQIVRHAPNPVTLFLYALALVVSVKTIQVLAEAAVCGANQLLSVGLVVLAMPLKFVYFYAFIVWGTGEYRVELAALDAVFLPMSQLREIASAQAAIRSVPAQVVTITADRLGFDNDGPFLVTDIAGRTVRIRVDAAQLSQATMRPSLSLPSSQIETSGKEAKLLDALRPTAGEMPKSQISLLIDGVHMGFGVRVKEDVLLLTAHQADQLDAFPGEIAIAYGEKQRPLEPRPRRIGSFPRTSDLAAYRIPANMFSMLGCGVAKLGHVLSGVATVSVFDDIGMPVSCMGRLQRSEHVGIVEHTCWTIKGSSGAAVTQNGKVVALHTGADPAGKQRNLATSVRYLEQYLGEPKIVFEEDAKESYFANDRFDVDPEAEKLSRILHEYAAKHAIGPHKNHDLYEAANDLASEVQELRFSSGFLEMEEINALMDQLDMGLDHKNLAKDYFTGRLNVPGSSHKNLTKSKYAESNVAAFVLPPPSPQTKLPFVETTPLSFVDIKESACSLESTSSASSNSPQTEPVTQTGSVSKKLDGQGRSSRRRLQQKLRLSQESESAAMARTVTEPSSLQKESPRCTCLHAGQAPSSVPSSTKPADSSDRKTDAIATDLRRPTAPRGGSTPKP